MKTYRATSKTENTYETINQVRDFRVVMDNAPENGGQDLGATPKEHLCMALGSCTTMTLKMYLNRKEWVHEHIFVETKLKTEGKESVFMMRIEVKGEFDDKQKKRLTQIAKLCPIHKLLASGNEIQMDFIFD
ncbi:MAG: OsmC family protein [Flavobacteriales bacterium]